jgi:hypothetical protein
MRFLLAALTALLLAVPAIAPAWAVTDTLDAAPTVAPSALLSGISSPGPKPRPHRSSAPHRTGISAGGSHSRHHAPVKPSGKAQASGQMVSFNEKTHKYHEAGCRYYGCGACDEMPLSQALAAGGIPCQKCH